MVYVFDADINSLVFFPYLLSFSAPLQVTFKRRVALSSSPSGLLSCWRSGVCSEWTETDCRGSWWWTSFQILTLSAADWKQYPAFSSTICVGCCFLRKFRRIEATVSKFLAVTHSQWFFSRLCPSVSPSIYFRHAWMPKGKFLLDSREKPYFLPLKYSQEASKWKVQGMVFVCRVANNRTVTTFFPELRQHYWDYWCKIMPVTDEHSRFFFWWFQCLSKTFNASLEEFHL